MKEIKETWILLPIKQKWEITHVSSTHFDEINFISDDLQLLRKIIRVKSDTPILTNESYLDTIKKFFYAHKYEYVITKWGKKWS